MTAATVKIPGFQAQQPAIPAVDRAGADSSPFQRFGYAVLLIFLFLIFSRIFDVKFSSLHITGVSARVVFAMTVLSLGFVTALRDGKTAIAYYIGFDRDASAEGLPLYLRLLHATIADAIDWGCKRLSLGRTALEPKAALGAKPEPMSVWIRHRVPALNWLLRGLLGAVPHAEAPERNPFKSTPRGEDKEKPASDSSSFAAGREPG